MEPTSSRIVTFYSYKGGTGRSMALANFAWLVAASGKRVLAIDWDLEAPGLHRYFLPFLVDPELVETDGLIDAFWQITASAMADASSDDPGSGNIIDVAENLEDATRRLDYKFPTKGFIDFICAGRQSSTYSERVNSFNWKRFYELGGARALVSAKAYLRKHYDWVLIDSRTGVSDTSGICTIQMPDIVAAYFTLNRQSIDGVTGILQSIRDYRSASVNGSEIIYFPIATRIENAEQEKLETARGYARETLAEFLPKKMQSNSREYWDKMEISYRPAYAFEEILAAFGDATGASGAADTMLSQVEGMARLITGNQNLSVPEIVEADRNRVLSAYAFRDRPDLDKLSTTPDESIDTIFLRNVRAKEQLWRKSKFKWRYLLSRRELDLLNDQDRKEFGRNMTYYLRQSEHMQRILRTVDIGSLLSPILAIMIGLGYYYGIISPMYEKMDFIPTRSIMILIYGIFSVWFGFAMVWSAIMTRDRPYGVRLMDLTFLTIRGPFRTDIRDYDPDIEQNK